MVHYEIYAHHRKFGKTKQIIVIPADRLENNQVV